MPPRKQPKSLFELGIASVAQIIFKACVQIELRHKGDEDDILRIALTIQNFLLETIPAELLDNLFENRTQSLEYELNDPTILLKVYLHPHLRRLCCPTISIRAIQSDEFWLSNIPKLKNLTALDFRLMCTDDLLRLVGLNCPKLEYINCVSKMSTVNRRDNRNFNALRVELYVSDVGLRYLANCKELRTIAMNRKINSQCGGMKPTTDGIRELIKALPHIQYVSFEDLGSVISTGMEDVKELPLVKVSDTHPSREHVQEISRLCPKLKDLYMVKPLYVGDPIENDPPPESIVEALTESPLKLQYLGLENFPFNTTLMTFLSVKGVYLTCLQLIGYFEQINSQQILTLGEACPNVISLTLCGLYAERSFRYKFPKKSQRLFQKLKFLSLSGDNWDACVIVPMILRHATHINKVVLQNSRCEITLDSVLEELMICHDFAELTTVHFLDGCVITLSALESFVNHCPKISYMHIKAKAFTVDHVDKLVAELSLCNYDINIELVCPSSFRD